MRPAPALEEPLLPLDRLTAAPTAVERFAAEAFTTSRPAQARYYESLLPATPPGPGEQYAFEVDLDACSGCKACVTACHALNGLDDGEAWRDVGLLHGGTCELPVLQHVTSACHHCLEPACLSACPVDAYEKHPQTGIVRHLDDQCIGCQYCTLACPYDVPKYNAALGIVRKCDMCSDRLSAGEAPACVQACPHQAIRITHIRATDVVESCETNLFLPGAPEPRLTLPTTVYKTQRPLPRNLLPADYYTVRPEHAHLPLVLMLVLTQLSVGALAVSLLWQWTGDATFERLIPLHSAGALAVGLLALAASTLHLGRPQYAFRAVIGLRHSWLSREILAFGLFAACATAYAVAAGRAPSGPVPPHVVALGLAAAGCGLAGVVCSIAVYQKTRRPFWNGATTTVKFAGTTLVLGLAGTLVAAALGGVSFQSSDGRSLAIALCRGVIAVSAVKMAVEALIFLRLRDTHNTSLKRSALLMTGTLARVTQARFALGGLGGLLLPALMLMDTGAAHGSLLAGAAGAVLLFVACLAGELCERYLFFTAVVAPKMPGGLGT